MNKEKIEAKDLRIGNWMYGSVRTTEPMQVTSIDKTVCKIGEYLTGYEHVNPIPLSSEILHKFGFEIMPLDKNENSYHANSEKNFGNPVLYFNKYQYIKTNGAFNYVFIDKIRFECKFLHQLQNLYYALTLTELTVKI